MRFKRGIILGSGKLAAVCGEILADWRLPAEIYDMGDSVCGFLSLAARRAGIPYYAREPEEVFRELAAVSEPTLIVSAINPRILPGYLLKNPCILAVNCHQALLPAHPGRNAEMWAVYEGDEKTGITWHIAAEQVDSGRILIQKELPITGDSTAYTIFQQQIRLAGEAFRELVPELLGEEREDQPSVFLVSAALSGEAAKESRVGDSRCPAGRKLHYSWQVPNEGILDPEWDARSISRFLRATDYGILPVIKLPAIMIDGQKRRWKKYKITEEHRFPEGMCREGKTLWLQKEELLFELRLV